MHSVTDRQTDRQTDGRQDDASSRPYCVAVRSAKMIDREPALLMHAENRRRVTTPTPCECRPLSCLTTIDCCCLCELPFSARSRLRCSLDHTVEAGHMQVTLLCTTLDRRLATFAWLRPTMPMRTARRMPISDSESIPMAWLVFA